MSNKEKRQKYRAWHQKEGLCRDCPKDISPGSIFCPSCLYKKNKRDRRYYEEHREYLLKKRRFIHNRRILEGKCPRCGKPLSDEETRYCFACVIGTRIGSRIRGIVCS